MFLESAAFGGVLRLLPEVLKFFDRKGERAHELAMNAHEVEILKLQGSQQLQLADATAHSAATTQALSALQDAVRSQAVRSGVRWIDGLSQLVRPFWTYYVLLTWGVVKVTDVWFALAQSLPWSQVRPLVWGPEDVGMIAALSTFWFLDRVIVKQAR